MVVQRFEASVSRRRLACALALSLAALVGVAAPHRAEASVSVGVGISVGTPPPPLPVYVQPVIPGPGYIWVPGYWAWGDDGYYWVPGTWVLPPYVGALWTPGWWGWSGGLYVFHMGYWGRHVGFYGGINYGFGYGGVGYAGGYWRGGAFFYNRSVNRIDNVHITHVYNTTVNNVSVNRTSFNGGRGGINARPNAQEMAFARESHMPAVAAQTRQSTVASRDPSMRASFNRGAPAIGGTTTAGALHAAAPPSAAAFNTQRMGSPATSPAAHSDMALRSSGFAPHAGPGASSGSSVRTMNRDGGYKAHTAQMPASEPARSMGTGGGYVAHTARYPSYGGPASPYRAPSYRAPQQRAPAASHAPAPHASAPRGAPHEEHH